MKKLMENWRRYLTEAIEDEPPHVGPPETIYDEGGVQIVSTEDEGVIVMVNGERVADGFFDRSADAFFMEKSSKSFNSREEMAQHYRTGIREAITLDIEVGDIVLGGKYKNKRIEVKEIGTDEIGQPTINGKSLLKFRIEKQLPDSKKSRKTLDAEKAEKEEAQDK